jgi:hypothetical protein
MNENFASTNESPLGFILIRNYPGNIRKIGSFEQFTTGEFLQYPGVWHPVYKAGKFEGQTETHKFRITVTIDEVKQTVFHENLNVNIVIEMENK